MSRGPSIHPGGTARLDRDAFAGDAEVLARMLLGTRLLVREEAGGWTGGRIVETEAYLGGDDLASHSRLGRRTSRTEVMFGPAGVSYVYLVYGLHHCFNVVAGPPGSGAAVLVRALEPEVGLEAMRARRPRCGRDEHLAAGPGRLCAALGITRADGGVDLADSRRIRLEPVASPGPWPIRRSPRIGVDFAGAWAAAPLRFLLEGHPSVSRGRPSGGGDPSPPSGAATE
jgi:DNA-3-methyladenine glycosylase